MLDKNGTRQLAYVAVVDSISPIDGADRVELAHVGGWQVMVRKGLYHPGDVAVYFEIDSKVAQTEAFEFLAPKHYAIKTQKYFKGKVLSQGLLMNSEELGWPAADNERGIMRDAKGVEHHFNDESRFVTKELGVTYYDPDDVKRKSMPSKDPYKVMAQRNRELFKHFPFRQLMRYPWGRKFLYIFFGNKKAPATAFPKKFAWIKPTDEERIENLPTMLNDKRVLVATEKLDGTSSTYILERKGRRKFEFYVCSRNVRQLTPDQKTFHPYNIYWNMAIKYHIEDHLKQYLNDNPDLEYVGLQGESVGSVQGNPLKLKEDDFYGFNFIRSDVGRISSLDGKRILESWGMKWVPIVSTNWVNPDTMKEMKTLATGKSLVNPSVLREGLVYRDPKDNSFSFKNVSNEYLCTKDKNK